MGIVSYIPYIKNMIKGKTKPHVFTWLLWSIGSLIMFVGQRSDGAWAWSRWNLAVSVIAIRIVIYSLLHKGQKYITTHDRVLFWLAILAIIVYLLTDDRRRSVMLINIVDTLSFIPTIRKSRSDPHTETMSLYMISVFKFMIVIAATAQYSFVTTSNSILRVILNAWFVGILYRRRKALQHHTI